MLLESARKIEQFDGGRADPVPGRLGDSGNGSSGEFRPRGGVPIVGSILLPKSSDELHQPSARRLVSTRPERTLASWLWTDLPSTPVPHAAIYAAQVVGVALVYGVAAKLSLRLALVHGQVTPIWPPTGIAVVALFFLGRRLWPAILLGAFLVNAPISPSLVVAGSIAIGNTAAPLLAVVMLERVRFRPELDRIPDAVGSYPRPWPARSSARAAGP